eukprot:TRINITY_DN88899_c0_g1_i1.p1 TRINITY_DN88899_c0_g1~~TRINITY_DN88899_c0_g1_i1.p1  ORF type:complete len:319 (-),score=-2.73 TRINITY_DN88899_c0_g1_i1:130-1086(-)
MESRNSELEEVKLDITASQITVNSSLLTDHQQQVEDTKDNFNEELSNNNKAKGWVCDAVLEVGLFLIALGAFYATCLFVAESKGSLYVTKTEGDYQYLVLNKIVDISKCNNPVRVYKDNIDPSFALNKASLCIILFISIIGCLFNFIKAILEVCRLLPQENNTSCCKMFWELCFYRFHLLGYFAPFSYLETLEYKDCVVSTNSEWSLLGTKYSVFTTWIILLVSCAIINAVLTIIGSTCGFASNEGKCKMLCRMFLMTHFVTVIYGTFWAFFIASFEGWSNTIFFISCIASFTSILQLVKRCCYGEQIHASNYQQEHY